MAIWYVDIYNGHDRNTVTNAVASNPSGSTVLITFPTTGIPHDYVTGMQVLLSSFSAWLNGTWTITVVDDFSFTLNGAVWQATADASGTCDAAAGHEGGSTWETAWRTLNYGARSGRIAPGDEIRISKTPDPVSIGNVFWSASKNVILEAARTQTIFSGDAPWIKSANVNSVRTTSEIYYKYGTGSYSIATLAAFTTGKAVYYTLPSSLDLSSFQELSLYAKPSTNIAENCMRICLCSDAYGAVIVDEFRVPYNSGSKIRAWLLQKTGGGNLGSSINSIAVYFDTDPGTLTIYLNNILATKINDINQSCLISKCGSATGGKEEGEDWYQVGWIDGTTVAIDNHIEVTDGNRRFNNYGEDTVESFIRTPFIFPQVLPFTNWGGISTDGTLNAVVSYKGGFEIGTNDQNGLTFLASVNGATRGIQLARSYLFIERLAFTRFEYAYYISTANHCHFEIQNCVANVNYGVYMSLCFNNKINTYNMHSNGASGLYLYRSSDNMSEYCSGHHCSTNGHGGLRLESSFNNLFKDVSCNGSNINLSCVDSANNKLKYRQSTNGFYTGWGLSCDNSEIELINATLIAGINNFSFSSYDLSKFTKVKIIDSMLNGSFVSRGIVSRNAEIYMDYGDSYAPREGDLHYWRVKINMYHNALAPLRFKIAEFAFEAGFQVTIKAWIKRDSEESTGKLVLQENITCGISEMSVAASTFGFSVWEQLTLSFVPLVEGVGEIAFDFSTTSSLSRLSIGSLEITQSS